MYIAHISSYIVSGSVCIVSGSVCSLLLVCVMHIYHTYICIHVYIHIGVCIYMYGVIYTEHTQHETLDNIYV